MDTPLAEKMERQLQEFDQKRNHYEKEIIQIKEDIKQAIDHFFDEFVREVEEKCSETDVVIDGCIKEFKRLNARKQELGELRQKLSPVLELLGGGSV